MNENICNYHGNINNGIEKSFLINTKLCNDINHANNLYTSDMFGSNTRDLAYEYSKRYSNIHNNSNSNSIINHMFDSSINELEYSQANGNHILTNNFIYPKNNTNENNLNYGNNVFNTYRSNNIPSNYKNKLCMQCTCFNKNPSEINLFNDDIKNAHSKNNYSKPYDASSLKCTICPGNASTYLNANIGNTLKNYGPLNDGIKNGSIIPIIANEYFASHLKPNISENIDHSFFQTYDQNIALNLNNTLNRSVSQPSIPRINQGVENIRSNLSVHSMGNNKINTNDIYLYPNILNNNLKNKLNNNINQVGTDIYTKINYDALNNNCNFNNYIKEGQNNRFLDNSLYHSNINTCLLNNMSDNNQKKIMNGKRGSVINSSSLNFPQNNIINSNINTNNNTNNRNITNSINNNHINKNTHVLGNNPNGVIKIGSGHEINKNKSRICITDPTIDINMKYIRNVKENIFPNLVRTYPEGNMNIMTFENKTKQNNNLTKNLYTCNIVNNNTYKGTNLTTDPRYNNIYKEYNIGNNQEDIQNIYNKNLMENIYNNSEYEKPNIYKMGNVTNINPLNCGNISGLNDHENFINYYINQEYENDDQRNIIKNNSNIINKYNNLNKQKMLNKRSSNYIGRANDNNNNNFISENKRDNLKNVNNFSMNINNDCKNNTKLKKHNRRGRPSRNNILPNELSQKSSIFNEKENESNINNNHNEMKIYHNSKSRKKRESTNKESYRNSFEKEDGEENGDSGNINRKSYINYSKKKKNTNDQNSCISSNVSISSNSSFSSDSSFFTNGLNENERKRKRNENESLNNNFHNKKNKMIEIKKKRPTVIDFLNEKWNRNSVTENVRSYSREYEENEPHENSLNTNLESIDSETDINDSEIESSECNSNVIENEIKLGNEKEDKSEFSVTDEELTENDEEQNIYNNKINHVKKEKTNNSDDDDSLKNRSNIENVAKNAAENGEKDVAANVKGKKRKEMNLQNYNKIKKENLLFEKKEKYKIDNNEGEGINENKNEGNKFKQNDNNFENEYNDKTNRNIKNFSQHLRCDESSNGESKVDTSMDSDSFYSSVYLSEYSSGDITRTDSSSHNDNTSNMDENVEICNSQTNECQNDDSGMNTSNNVYIGKNENREITNRINEKVKKYVDSNKSINKIENKIDEKFVNINNIFLRVCSIKKMIEENIIYDNTEILNDNQCEDVSNIFCKNVIDTIRCYKNYLENEVDNNCCLVKDDNYIYTNLKNLKYINKELILNKLKLIFLYKGINIYECIILFSYLFYKKSKYLDFNKVYLYNTMKKLSPCLWELNKKCNDIEMKTLFFFISKIFIFHDYFIFRINIFFFNWFILHLYKIKLKNTSYLEDINILINIMTGFLSNKKFLNYSILFVINIVLHKNNGKSLYTGLNYPYVCALYLHFFSKIICLSNQLRKFVKLYERMLKNTNLFISKLKQENDNMKNTPNTNANKKIQFSFIDDGIDNMNKEKTNKLYNVSMNVIRNKRKSQNIQNSNSKIQGTEKIFSPRQDLIILYILYMANSNYCIYVNIIRHIFPNIINLKVTYNFSKLKVKSRYFYKKIIRSLNHAKKYLKQLSKRNKRGRRKKCEEADLKKDEKILKKKKKKKNDINYSQKNLYNSYDKFTNENYSFIYIFIGLLIEQISFNFNENISLYFQNEKIQNIYKNLFLQFKGYTDITFKYIKFYSINLIKKYKNIWLRNVFKIVNLKNNGTGLDDYFLENPLVDNTRICLAQQNCFINPKDSKINYDFMLKTDDQFKNFGDNYDKNSDIASHSTLTKDDDTEYLEQCDENNNSCLLKKKKSSLLSNFSKKNKKGYYFMNKSFVNSTFYILSKCLKTFKRSNIFSIVFDLLFLSFIHQIKKEELASFLCYTFSNDYELSEIIISILIRLDTTRLYLQNIYFLNYFLKRGEIMTRNGCSIDSKYYNCINLKDVEISLADIYSFYFSQCTKGSKNEKIKNEVTNQINYFDKRLYTKPCKCMFLSYLIFFSLIFKNFKMYFMHFTKFSYTLKKKEKSKHEIKNDDANIKEITYTKNEQNNNNNKSFSEENKYIYMMINNGKILIDPIMSYNYIDDSCYHIISSPFDNWNMYDLFTNRTKYFKLDNCEIYDENYVCVENVKIDSDTEKKYEMIKKKNWKDSYLENGEPKTEKLGKKHEAINDLNKNWKEIENRELNLEEIMMIMYKYDLIVCEHVLVSYFSIDKKKKKNMICTGILKKKKNNNNNKSYIEQELSNVIINKHNKIDNLYFFKEDLAYHILHELYKYKSGYGNIEIGNILLKINGKIFKENVENKIEFNKKKRRRKKRKQGISEGENKNDIINCNIDMVERDQREIIYEKYLHEMNNIMKWNKNNIEYNNKKKKNINLKRRRNKYTNIIIDIYPLVFLSLVKLLNGVIIINDDVKKKSFDVKNEIFPVNLSICIDFNKNEEIFKIHDAEIKKYDKNGESKYLFMKTCLCNEGITGTKINYQNVVNRKNKHSQFDNELNRMIVDRNEGTTPIYPNEITQKYLIYKEKGKGMYLNLIVKLLYKEIKSDFFLVQEYFDEKIYIYRSLLIMLILKYLSFGYGLFYLKKKFLFFFIQRVFRLLCFRLMSLFLSNIHLSKLTSEIIIIDESLLVSSYISQLKKKKKNQIIREEEKQIKKNNKNNDFLRNKSYNMYKNYSENFFFNWNFVDDVKHLGEANEDDEDEEDEEEEEDDDLENDLTDELSKLNGQSEEEEISFEGNKLRGNMERKRNKENEGKETRERDKKDCKNYQGCNYTCNCKLNKNKKKKHIIYKPFVAFGSLVMTKKEVLDLGLLKKDEIKKKEKIYINKSILKNKQKIKNSNFNSGINLNIEENKESINMSIISLLALMSTLKKNGNTNMIINFYLNLLIEKFLEKKKYIHIDDSYLINSYNVNLVNPLNIEIKRYFYIYENNSIKKKKELISNGYKFYSSACTLNTFQIIFFEVLKTYLSFNNSNYLGALISKIGRLNNIYSDKNIHFKIKINRLLCNKLHTLMLEQLMNMKLNKIVTTNKISVCKFFFISLLDENENPNFFLNIPYQNRRNTSIISKEMQIYNLQVKCDNLSVTEQWHHKQLTLKNENYISPCMDVEFEKNNNYCKMKQIPSTSTVEPIRDNSKSETLEKYEKHDFSMNNIMDKDGTENYKTDLCRIQNEKEIIKGSGEYKRKENVKRICLSQYNNNNNNNSSNDNTILNSNEKGRVTNIRIVYNQMCNIGYKDEGSSMRMVKNTLIYMKENDINKLIDSFEKLNKTIYECSIYIYKNIFVKGKPQDVINKQISSIYLWFQNFMNLLKYEKSVIHQLYNKYQGTGIYIKKNNILNSHVIKINSNILNEIEEMKKNIKPYLPIIEKNYLSIKLKDNDKNAKKRDNPIESNFKQNEIEEEYQINPPYNKKQESYIEDYNEDYTELNSFIDFNMDKSSGILLEGKQKNDIIHSNNKELEDAVNSGTFGIHRLNEYKVDEDWLTYIRSLI
ncbi:conserved Plasmodium protein, unknown function [Plasmodium berghei]|uniref:Uncharacterized protein n=2 Tax=Plasmodium berghei TaxID=5821 RepID=A0A509ACX1_PLABA|nr:conserved Plasmodium protein, unknown function [Plasmodium berghei ANKA]SCL91603.1 conserved Plasmodium protein, unknown function [Plasmodium berghei]SCM15495.1 conserved Plasmodium protein, unknown function [Plasmodium berghei]SCN22462.1 conserved Plasmodium protein, unknown function [Plasmodium berghei]VUC54260.1 conserved Plasmodium protein, unknown function [Plasmodium berghei ANKA]|eukprot:XP_034420093.1 conserved Plasmodium protein, unknown function [Plasmodium berghei ANKA]